MAAATGEGTGGGMTCGGGGVGGGVGGGIGGGIGGVGGGAAGGGRAGGTSGMGTGGGRGGEGLVSGSGDGVMGRVGRLGVSGRRSLPRWAAMAKALPVAGELAAACADDTLNIVSFSGTIRIESKTKNREPPANAKNGVQRQPSSRDKKGINGTTDPTPAVYPVNSGPPTMPFQAPATSSSEAPAPPK